MRLTKIEIKHYPDYLPEEREDGILYVSDKYQTAIHNCACGCGWKTVTPLKSDYGWTLEGSTLRPSIGNFQYPCKSHYYITNGNIDWL